MPVYKNEKSDSWYVSFYFKDWNGQTKRKLKRGFATKREAAAWERSFQAKTEGTANITMNEYFPLYREDVKNKIKLNTWMTKEHMIKTKILPFFGGLKLTEITPLIVVKWHNLLLSVVLEDGSHYKPTYLKTIHAQLSAMLNHAVRFYGLKNNPCKTAGRIGSNRSGEMNFWTKDEYQRFSAAIRDKDLSFYAFEILYWCGIRLGELRALTKRDFDFEKKTLRVNKSSQTIGGKEIVTTPKTPRSIRTILLPDFLADEIQEYFLMISYFGQDDPIFPMSKSYFNNEMTRGCRLSGVKRIRVHDLRHSHISMLIDMGFSPVDIADRMGHESIKITLDYAHMFPSRQIDMAKKLNQEGEAINYGESTETT